MPGRIAFGAGPGIADFANRRLDSATRATARGDDPHPGDDEIRLNPRAVADSAAGSLFGDGRFVR